nr:glycine receptor subunit alpha-2-like [Penaeus vannamei]
MTSFPSYVTTKPMASAEIWQPLLTIHDGAQSPADISVKSKILRVNREAPPLEDDDSRTGEDKLYHGANHTMKMTQQYTVGLMCQFSLQMYPFDTQLCTLTFNVSNMADRFEFIKGGVDFSAERRLLEYRMVKEEMSHPQGNLKVVQVTLKFKNQYGYYIGNAVVPSLFMVVICYLTLLFDMDDFMDRIMVSLTSLLVLASLFSQTSQSIPKTAYLKHIDVWYIVLISLDFFIIVVLVVIENLRLYSEEDDRVFTMTGASGDKMAAAGGKGEKGGKLRMATVSYRALSLRLNRASVVVFPIVSTLFVLAFFMIGLLSLFFLFSIPPSSFLLSP